MTERPIMMTSESVRAILDGRKTQTRRVMKPQPELRCNFYEFGGAGWSCSITSITPIDGHSLYYACPYGVPGDRLWVRESWTSSGMALYWKATDGADRVANWNSPIFMPRWASRLTLEVVSVRVERLTDISDSDCYAEGIISPQNDILGEPYYSFKDLWDSINAKRGYPWSSNPWVWVISFRVVQP